MTFDEVKAEFTAENPLNLPHSSNKWALEHPTQSPFLRANRMSQGYWEHRHLTGAEAADILLMAHSSEGGKDPIALHAQIQLCVALARLKEKLETYAIDNPTCWNKIQWHRGKQSRIYLVQWADGTYEHLDGFHRLLARGLDGTLDSGVDATVAVEPTK